MNFFPASQRRTGSSQFSKTKYEGKEIYWETLAAIGAATGSQKLIKFAYNHKGGYITMYIINDEIMEQLYSEQIILGWIIKDCMIEFHDCDVKEIAEKYIIFPQAVQVSDTPDETAYNINFSLLDPKSGESLLININIETQDFSSEGALSQWGIGQCCQIISSGIIFQNTKKVYSLWIYMNPPKGRENSITHYLIEENNLVGNVEEQKSNYDLMETIIICLGKQEDKDCTGVLKLLNILLSTETEPAEKCRILKDDFDIEMTPTHMCSLSKKITVYSSGGRQRIY